MGWGKDTTIELIHNVSYVGGPSFCKSTTAADRSMPSPFLTLITTYLVERAARRDLRPDRAFTTLLCTSSNQRGVFGGAVLQRYTAIRAVHSLSTWVGDMIVTRRRESVLP